MRGFDNDTFKKATEVDFLFSASLGSAFSSEAIKELFHFYSEIFEGDDLDFDDLVKRFFLIGMNILKHLFMIIMKRILQS